MVNKLISIAVLLLMAIQSKANDLDHRRVIQSAMMVSIQDPEKIDFPFLSTVDIIKENGRFTRSSGWYLIDVQPVAASAYDPTVAYDITKFYQSSNTRFRFISNYRVPEIDTFLSYGFDSGTKAEKLQISKSFFLGFAKAINPVKSHYFFTHGGIGMGRK